MCLFTISIECDFLYITMLCLAKSPEEIRKTFGIINDFSPEEEDQARRENGTRMERCAIWLFVKVQYYLRTEEWRLIISRNIYIYIYI